MTLLASEPKQNFIEQSPMGSMKLWRHERLIKIHLSNPDIIVLIDQLTFRPKITANMVKKFIKVVFIHRHKVLRHHFNT